MFLLAGSTLFDGGERYNNQPVSLSLERGDAIHSRSHFRDVIAVIYSSRNYFSSIGRNNSLICLRLVHLFIV